VTTEENKALVRRYVEEAWHQGAPAAPFFTPDYRRYPTGGDGPPLDGATQGARIAAFREAFPDLRFTLDDLVAEGDRVVFRATMRGTHAGPFRGVAATGRAIAVEIIDVVRVADGRFAEHWGGPDLLTLWRQLGVSPSA
jgi:ketosteroid isomerase-like protein